MPLFLDSCKKQDLTIYTITVGAYTQDGSGNYVFTGNELIFDSEWNTKKSRKFFQYFQYFILGTTANLRSWDFWQSFHQSFTLCVLHWQSGPSLTERSFADWAILRWMSGPSLTERSFADWAVLHWLSRSSLTERSFADWAVLRWLCGHSLTHQSFTDWVVLLWLIGTSLTERSPATWAVLHWQNVFLLFEQSFSL